VNADSGAVSACSADAKGFVVLPRRWVVERSWSWTMRARRHARDYERLPEMRESLITWAAITLMARRLARKSATPSWPRTQTAVDG
jgi:transposase